jgi:hypothetical protein
MRERRELLTRKIRFLIILPCVWAGFFFCISAVSAVERTPEGKIRISREDLNWIGYTIFQKECGGRKDNLIIWNRGEDFASLGIGHFIWYPQGRKGPFEESFPAFIEFARNRGLHIPRWMESREIGGCPWMDRNSFYRARNSARMKSLELFMAQTMTEQSIFIVNRLTKAIPKMMAAVSYDRKRHVKRQFYRVANSTTKLYALIDYVNFKGEGTCPSERYKNQGWGLLQVLEEMNGTAQGKEALFEFSRAAETVLARRVANAPMERNEQRWLSGWKNRVKSYRYL